MATDSTTDRQSSPPPDVPDRAQASSAPVVFFDGVCGLCNRSVDILLARDHAGLFRFAPLQGKTARSWLKIEPGEPLNSIVLVDRTGVYRKSDAVWRILVRLGGLWRLFGWALRAVPRPLRNSGYDLVARYRYRWFGRKESCRLPTPQERARFLP